MLLYPAALPLSRQTLDYAAGIIRHHRRKTCSCWRKGETFGELAAGFGVRTATA